MNTTTTTIREPHPTDADYAALRTYSYTTPTFNPPRRRWPGVLAATVLGAVVAGVAVSSLYDQRSLGERIDATMATTSETVQRQADAIKAGASEVATNSAQATGQVAGTVASTLSDAGITASVKAALTADPALSAFKIDVDTHGGVVSLSGPAPDEKSRERAAVLAAAPEGVRSVDNRLVVSPPAHVIR